MSSSRAADRTFTHEFVVDQDRAAVWAFLWDVPAVASCLPGAEQVDTISELAEYAVRIRRRIGPFRMRFELRVTVADRREPELIVLEIDGEDRRLRTRVRQELALRLEEAGEQTRVGVTATMQLDGVLATLAPELTAMHVNETIAEFGETMRSRLAGAERAA